MALKYIFGPVSSRRLGKSLGVDTIPMKTCNLNCVYCQLGFSKPHPVERKSYFPREEILAEIQQALALHAPGEIDWISFVSSGEPTLDTELGWLLREVKAMTALPVSVITNGTLLYLPDVRQDLMVADAVLPSLDAGTSRLYRRINRPHRSCTFKQQLDGLITFRQEFSGKFWLEVMLIKDLNDTESALRDLKAAIEKIQPDQVHLVLPTRSPSEVWVEPSDDDGLLRARAILGDVAEIVNPKERPFDLTNYDDLSEALLGIITRHPMRESELERALSKWLPDTDKLQGMLTHLADQGRIQPVERYGARFWTAAPLQFGSSELEFDTPQRLQKHKTD